MPRKPTVHTPFNAYHREYKRRRYWRRKAIFIEELGGKCAKCGSAKRLEFDHKHAKSRNFIITVALACMAEKPLRRELRKCQLLCRKCHEAKSIIDAGNKSAFVAHGTLSRQRYCKCRKCQDAKNAWFAQWRAKRRAAGWKQTARGWVPPAGLG